MADEQGTDGNELESMYGNAPGIDELAAEVVEPGSTKAESPESDPEEKEVDKSPKQQGLPSDILDDSPTSIDDKEIYEEIEKEFPDPEGGAEKDIQAMQSMRERIVALRKENDTLKDGGDEDIKTRLAETEAQLEKSNFAQSPRFQNEFVKPVNEAWEQIAAIAKAYELPPEVINAAARAEVKERDAILSGEGIPQAGLVQLLPLFNQFSSLMASANAEIENFKTKTEEEVAQEMKMMDETTTTALNSAISTLQANNHFLLRESKENPDWFPDVVNGAREMMSGSLSPAQLAEAALKSQLADHYKEFYLSQTQKLKAEISQLQANQGIEQSYRPKIDSNSGPIRPRAKKEEAMSLDELAEETVGI